MTAAVWDSHKCGLIFAISKSMDEAGVSVFERPSDFREASELSIDKVTRPVTESLVLVLRRLSRKHGRGFHQDSQISLGRRDCVLIHARIDLGIGERRVVE